MDFWTFKAYFLLSLDCRVDSYNRQRNCWRAASQRGIMNISQLRGHDHWTWTIKILTKIKMSKTPESESEHLAVLPPSLPNECLVRLSTLIPGFHLFISEKFPTFQHFWHFPWPRVPKHKSDRKSCGKPHKAYCLQRNVSQSGEGGGGRGETSPGQGASHSWPRWACPWGIPHGKGHGTREWGTPLEGTREWGTPQKGPGTSLGKGLETWLGYPPPHPTVVNILKTLLCPILR